MLGAMIHRTLTLIDIEPIACFECFETLNSIQEQECALCASCQAKGVRLANIYEFRGRSVIDVATETLTLIEHADRVKARLLSSGADAPVIQKGV